MGANCGLPSSIGSTLLSLPAAMGEPLTAFRVFTHTYTCVLTCLAAVGMSGNPDRPSFRHTRGSPQPSAGKKHAQRRSPNLVLCSCLLVSCLVWPALSAGLPAIDECEPRECGGVHNISYPFWIEERQPPQCGYPAFKLSCKDDAPFVKISGKEYAVARIFYNNQSFMVSSDELSKSNCPVPNHNLSLDATPFYLNALDRNLSFFLGCDGGGPGYRIECAAGGDGDPYVVGNHSRSDREEATKNCGSSVSWPYLGGGSAEGDEKYAVLLKRGFLLNWNAVVNCSVCTGSGGRCRYDLSRESFSCDCSDRPHAVSCNGSSPLPGASQNGRGISKSRKIAIGVGAGVGGFLLACVLCFLVYRRKRMRARTGSSTLLFRTASSEPPNSQKDPETGSTHYYPTHVFKYEELSEATDGFSEANELGDGGFGTVYKGKLRDGRIVAVKRLYESNYKRVEQFMNEVAILHRLQHPNLVTLYGCTSRHSRELLLVYEYVPNGTVADHLHGGEDRAAAEGSPPPLGWPVRLGIAVETATALAYLHKVEPPIIHRDVKTNNILLDDNFHVKVADFGLSRLFPADATHVSTAPQGTPGYVDPEYHQCYQLTDKSDVYSFGVVLAELISSKPAVDITRHRHEINLATMAINKIQSGALRELVDPALDFDTDWAARRMVRLVAELAFRCLQAEKEMRPTMEDVAEVLRGIRDCHRDDDAASAAAAAAGGDTADRAVRDDASLLKNKNVPFSPDSVMDKWTSTTTTPNTSA